MATLARDIGLVAKGHPEAGPIGEEAVFTAPGKGRLRGRYTVEADMERCIGCRMCMVDCAAHHADPEELPIAYPGAWALLSGPGQLEDIATMRGKGTAPGRCAACMEMMDAGLEPVCVRICPRGALSVKRVPQPAGRKHLLTLVVPAKGA